LEPECRRTFDVVQSHHAAVRDFLFRIEHHSSAGGPSLENPLRYHKRRPAFAHFITNAGLISIPGGERSWLAVWRPDRNRDIQVLRELEFAQVAGVRPPGDPDEHLLAFAQLGTRDVAFRQRLRPDVEKFAERERAIARRLDMNDAVRCMRVHPVEAWRGQRPPDVLRNDHRLPMIAHAQVRMEMQQGSLGGVARNPIDRGALRHALRARRSR